MPIYLALQLSLAAIGSGLGEHAGLSDNIVQEDGTRILQEDGVSTILQET